MAFVSGPVGDPVYMSRKIRKFRTDKFDTCNSCKRLVPSRLHELHESKFPFVSRIEFIRSKLSNFSAHVYGINNGSTSKPPHRSLIVSQCCAYAQTIFVRRSCTYGGYSDTSMYSSLRQIIVLHSGNVINCLFLLQITDRRSFAWHNVIHLLNVPECILPLCSSLVSTAEPR